jgi:hypothetical protein
MPRLGHDRWTTTTMDGTVNSRPAGETAVRGIDDRINMLIGDVANYQLNRLTVHYMGCIHS